jgi:hypothetical protein
MMAVTGTPYRPSGTATPAADTADRGRSRLPSWPLTTLYLGFPVWWLLGLGEFGFLLAAIPMAVRLLRRPAPVLLPRGFGLWALFLLWVVLGVFTLGLEAPGAIVDDGTVGRYLTFGYRLAVLLAATVTLLYVGNADEEDLPTRRLIRLLGYMFVVTAAGGVVGSLLPPIHLTSALNVLLPGGIADNPFVMSLTEPRTAEVQAILGYAESRPVAPFNYSNSWGANYSLFLPFFLLSWFGKEAEWRARVAPFVLVLSLIPVVYSLNRGLWGALGVGLAYVVTRLALLGRTRALQVLVVGAVIGGLLLAMSPLAATIQDRLDNPHSNERRGQLIVATVTSVVQGSPVLGFGTTRNVQGSFSSIAGGETVTCPACGVPPFGTQGTLWGVLFFHGLVGGALFLIFFLRWFLRYRRRPSAVAIAVTASLLMAGVELLVYDFGSAPVTTIMIGLALAWREERGELR